MLVNNAAVMKCRKTFTKDGIESQLGVNHMGHILLTYLLKSSLVASDSARYVQIFRLHYIGILTISMQGDIFDELGL